MGFDEYESHDGLGLAKLVSRGEVSPSDLVEAAMLDWTGQPESGCSYAVPAKERPYLEEIERDAGRLRIAFSSATPSGRPIDPEIESALQDTAKALENLGDSRADRMRQKLVDKYPNSEYARKIR